MFNIQQAVILAGGRGERLRPLTDHLPKPLAPVGGVPFLDYLIASIVAVGIKRIVLLLGYRAQMIMDRYGRSLEGGIQLSYSQGTAEDQTGRRLLNAYPLLDDHFLLLYGDNYWPIELDKMLKLYQEKNAKVQTTVFGNKGATGEYGKGNNVEVGADSFVKRYDKTRNSAGLNGVDIGYFLVGKMALEPKRTGNISFEEDLLPGFIARRELAAHVTDTQYHYITSMESLKVFESIVVQNRIEPISLRAASEVVSLHGHLGGGL